MLQNAPTNAPRRAAAGTVHSPPRTVPRPPWAAPGVLLMGVVALSLAAAGVSVLLLPWATTYDPWAWIVWGREIAHGELSTTTGPSWKPLPVMLTVPFSVAGDLAPALWLTVARASGVVAIAAAYAAGRRIAGPVAGAVAALALGLNLEFHRTVWLGNSEGFLIAALMLAIERHLGGAPRAAFAAGVAAALLRPEVWPFLFAYGLWLMWRDRPMRIVVVLSGAAVLALWAAPELWGSGELLRAADRAQEPAPTAVTFLPNPALAVMERAEAMLFGPVQLLALAGVAFALASFRTRRARATLAIATIAALWLALVAVMTVEGFSGNPRYVIAPVALICVLAGVGAGGVARVVGGRVERAGAATVVAAALGTGLIAAGMVPFVAMQAREVGKRTAVLEYQATLREQARVAIDRSGGRDAVARCGHVSAGDYEIPMLAWLLGRHLSEVELEPRAPGIVFQARSGPHSRRDPIVRSERFVFSHRAGPWRVLASCRKH